MAGFVIFSLRTCHSSFPHTLRLMPVFPDHPNLKRKPAVPQAPVASPLPTGSFACAPLRKGSFLPREVFLFLPSDFQFARPLGQLQKCVEPQASCGPEQSAPARGQVGHVPGRTRGFPFPRTAEQGARSRFKVLPLPRGPLSRGSGHGSRCLEAQHSCLTGSLRSRAPSQRPGRTCSADHWRHEGSDLTAVTLLRSPSSAHGMGVL